tara:strand:+ start:734 stop:1423 length:690 start_codon:yes stop_codon:yes gene_type:complete
MKSKLESTATFEASLYQLYFFQDQFQITKKQKTLLKLSMQCRNSIYFDKLKSLTRLTNTGLYDPFYILTAIRKNQPTLTILTADKESLKKPKRIRTIDSKDKIISDLKRCQLNFDMALNWLKYEKRSIKMSGGQAQIINETRKRDKEVYKTLKKLCLAKNKNHFTPMEILECIRSNSTQLKAILDGRPIPEIKNSKSSNKQDNPKPLPLDTNYKYPTKTSKSIWTVKKR